MEETPLTEKERILEIRGQRAQEQAQIDAKQRAERERAEREASEPLPEGLTRHRQPQDNKVYYHNAGYREADAPPEAHTVWHHPGLNPVLWPPPPGHVGVVFQVADHDGVVFEAFKLNIPIEELQSKPVLKLVQEVLISRNRQKIDARLPLILQGLRLPDAQFHRPDAGKRLTAETPLLTAGETPTSVMLIAMAGGGARADMVVVVGDARGFVAARALSVHQMGERSLGDVAAMLCECPRDDWARGTSASVALVNDGVSLTEVAHELVEAGAPWSGISVDVDPTIPIARSLAETNTPVLVLVRRADDLFARRGLTTTTVDVAWEGRRIEAVAVREFPVPRTPRTWVEWALRTAAAPLVVHGMMSPQLRDAVVQKALEHIDTDAVSVAVNGAPAVQMVPSDQLEVANPKRVVVEAAGHLFGDTPVNVPHLEAAVTVAACMRRLEAGEELYAPKSTWRALEVRSGLYKTRGDDDAGQNLLNAHSCLEMLHALGLFETVGRLDRADAAHAIACVLDLESFFRVANSATFACLLGVDGYARRDEQRFASRLGVISLLTLQRVPELQKLAASIRGDDDEDEPSLLRKALVVVENARRQFVMQQQGLRGQPHVAAFCLSVLCQAAAARGKNVNVLGEQTPPKVYLNILRDLPFDLLEAPLDESYLDAKQRQRMRETISDLLLLWDLVRPDVAKDFRRLCERCVKREESKGKSDAYVSGRMCRNLAEKLRGGRSSKRAGAQRKLLLRRCEPDAVYSHLFVRDPPAGLRSLLARFRFSPKLRDAGPSPPEATALVAATTPRDSEAKPKKLGAKAAKKQRQKERKKANALREAAARAAAPAVPTRDAREAVEREAERAPAPDADEEETASEASADDAVANNVIPVTATSLDATAAEAPPDDGDGDWTDVVRTRREQRAAAAEAAAAAAAEARVRDAEAASLALARRLEAEDAIAAGGPHGGGAVDSNLPPSAPQPAPRSWGAVDSNLQPEAAPSAFCSFLAAAGLAHHADRLRAQAVHSMDVLSLLNRDDIVACGVPAADAVRLEAALAERAGVAVEGVPAVDAVRLEAALAERAGVAVEESKSSEAVAAPRGKVLVDEEMYDDAAARAAELESSLTAHQSELRRLKVFLAQRGIPDALVCPISQEIYEDPVIAADGFSYERREIEAWFGRGKRTSPKTNEELPHTFLMPNRDLKSACQDFLDDVRKFEATGC